MSSAASPDILTRIADDRRRSIEALKLRTPAHVLRARLPDIHPAGRLERALRRGGPDGPIRVIAEIKRISPARGMLKADVDAIAQAAIYQASGASAISLVTEPDHFGGSLDWIDAVRGTTGLPLLLKDFVIDPWQILDAAVRGADAVLLITALLSDVLLQRYITEARLVGLDALVEVHTAAELVVAIRAGATLVGINNRDLKTLAVDLATSIELLPSVPPLVTAVSESGLSTPADLERLRATRCDAVLIGEAFMTSPDPAATLQTLARAARG